MSSPITFSGFNNIDFNTVLTDLMAQASQPLTALQTEQSNLKSQSTTYGTLATQASSLATAAAALSDPSQLTTFSATSSDPSAVSVTSGAGAAAGTYDIVVQSLARAQVTASASTAPDPNTTAVATGGTLTIGGVAVNVTGSVTLQGLADQINGTSGIGVNATVVRAGANAYRLVLTSQTTGAASAFTVTNGLSGGAGVTFTDTDGDGISGNSPADNAVNASDASVLVNNVQVQSSSNTITGAIPGVTITALQQDPTSSVSVNVNSDGTALASSVNAFITAYNSLAAFAQSQETAAANGDPTSIGNDSTLRQLMNQLTSTLTANYSGGAFTNLSQIGIEFTQTGTLQLNQTEFDNAVSSNGADIATIFAGANGAFTQLGNTLGDYSSSGTLITAIQNSLTQQQSQLTNQISAMQARLTLQQASLQAEFTAADTAIATLNSQSTAISNLNSSSSSSGGLTLDGN